MATRALGPLQASAVSLGCNNFGKHLDEAGTTAVVHAALDAGINFFHTADVYGGTRSEELLGKALGPRRKDVLIATKFGVPLDERRPGGASPAQVRAHVRAAAWQLTQTSSRRSPRSPKGDPHPARNITSSSCEPSPIAMNTAQRLDVSSPSQSKAPPSATGSSAPPPRSEPIQPLPRTKLAQPRWSRPMVPRAH